MDIPIQGSLDQSYFELGADWLSEGRVAFAINITFVTPDTLSSSKDL